MDAVGHSDAANPQALMDRCRRLLIVAVGMCASSNVNGFLQGSSGTVCPMAITQSRCTEGVGGGRKPGEGRE
jgi:hypothetical protein